MAQIPEYDKDRYKPSHEQIKPKTKVEEKANSFHINQIKKFKYYSNRNNAKKNGNLAKDTNIFVPTNVEGPLEGYEDKTGNKALVVTAVYIGLFIMFVLLTFNWFNEGLKFPIWLSLVTQVLIGIMVYIFIISRFIYKVDDRRIQEARNRGNKAINMANVWGINPGGISENVIYGKESTSVSYHGKEAIVLKLLKKSVLISDARQDWNHYGSLEKMEAIILKQGFQFSKFNTKYDTNNDYIWDMLDDNLADSSVKFGKEYSDIMIDFVTNLKKSTEAVSKVTVVYYIIKPNLISGEVSLQDLALQLPNILKGARCTISTVTNQEFLRLIKEYYGLRYLDIEEIVDNLSAFDVIPINVNLIGYVNNEGKIVDLKEQFKVQPQEFYKYTEDKNVNIKDPKRLQTINIEKYSIYGDKVVDQV